MAYRTIAGMRLYYEEPGIPDGPPLVLLHGFNGSGAFWTGQRAAFGARYRLLIPDWRGHGCTDNPDGPAAMHHRQFACDIIAFCRTLGLGRAAFCGESSGAMLLLTLALEAPACILAGATYFYGDDLRTWWGQQPPDTVVGTEEQVQALQATHTALGPDHWRSVVAAWIALGPHAHGEDFPEAEELRAIRTPVLIVHGDRDHFFPVAIAVGLYELLPDAELCVLPHTGHSPPTQRPEWFNAIVLDFVASAMYARSTGGGSLRR